ncbi:MAG TPA: DUF3293 domain-containing protein [Trebonia sp.]|jgi:hypothetical protein|nr:DUF3293 domain-containing protein [Trebonia sp.]
MSEELGGWDAYVEAVVRIETPDGARWLKPDSIFRTEGRYPDPDGRPIYVLTAHNPEGRLASDAANAAAQERLKARLRARGLTWWAADGGDPTWTHIEAGVALIGIAEADAVALGAEFKQDAIFAFNPATRRIVSCTDTRVETTGWTSEPDPGSVPG